MRPSASIGIAVASVCLLLPAIASAQVWVKGNIDCKAWAEARKGGENKASVEAYVVGVVDGLALGLNRDVWRTKSGSLGSDQVWSGMDNFCREKPLESVVQGAFALVQARTGGTTQQLPPPPEKK